MAHHFTQTATQLGAQLVPHLYGSARTPTPRSVQTTHSASTVGTTPAAVQPSTQTVPQRATPAVLTAPAATATPAIPAPSQLPPDKINTLQLLLNKSNVPTEDAFYAMMNEAVQPGALVFWSAVGGEPKSSEAAAKAYAKYYNKQLLRPLIQLHYPDYPDAMIFDKFKTMDYPTRQALVAMTWSRASRAFARHVKGRAVVVLKEPATNGTRWPSDLDCWAKDEFPVLTGAGSACTEILRVEADDWMPAAGQRGLKGLIIWTKAEGALNPPRIPQ